MLIDREGSHFIFVFHSDCVYRNYNYINYEGKALTNREYLEHWGKYVFSASREELADFAKELDPYVEEKLIPGIKYDRGPIERLGMTECVMCVYCDDRQKDEVWRILKNHNVEIRAWVYDRDTVARWMPGGVNLEKWIAGHGLNEDQAREVRENARLKFEKMFADLDAIFRGVEQ